MNKKAFLGVLLVTFFLTNYLQLQAQAITLTATAGSPGPTNYVNLGAAFNAINAGTHQGDITIDVIDLSEEFAPAVLNSSGAGPASYTSVLIRPTQDFVAIYNSGPNNRRGVIELKGADNVTIEGDNPNTPGTNMDLSIMASSTTDTFASVIRIVTAGMGAAASADNITLRNLYLSGGYAGFMASGNSPSVTSVAGPVNTSACVLVGHNGGSTDVDAPTAVTDLEGALPAGTTVNNLYITSCRMVGCGRGISFLGSSSASSTGISFTNNTFGDPSVSVPTNPPYSGSFIFSKGIHIQGANAVTLTGNNIVNIFSYLQDTLVGIELHSGIGTGLIDIGYNKITNTGHNAPSVYSARAMVIAGAGAEYNIHDNKITNTYTRGNAPLAAIEIKAGTAILSRNDVTRVRNFDATGSGSYGIWLNGDNNHVLVNNFVSAVNSYSGNTVTSTTLQPVGIKVDQGTGHKIIFNSIHLNGAPLGGSNPNGSSALMISSASSTGMEVMNNILSNQFSGWPAGSVHAGIFLPDGLSPAFNMKMNNNVYYTNGGTNIIAQLASGTTYTSADFNPLATTPAANFRAYTAPLTGGGNNDNASSGPNTTAPFTSATNLHINVSALNTADVEGRAAYIGIPTDFDFAGRDTLTPDIGADEFPGPTCISANGGTVFPGGDTICSGPASLYSLGYSAGTGIVYQWQVSNTPGGPYVNVTGGTGANTPAYTSGTLTPGTYYFVLAVTCTAGPLTQLSNEAVIVVSAAPVVNLGPDIVQANPPAVLNAGAGFGSYLWSTSDTTQTISVNTNGTYIVTVTDSDCGSTSSDTIQVFFTAGMNGEEALASKINLYPNPSDGVFNVAVHNLETDRLVIDIMDMTGRIVETHVKGDIATQTILPLNIQHLGNGSYILRVQANGQSAQLRFIVSK